MKAIVITEPGGPEVLHLEERPVPEIKGNEVLIKVKAAGVNRPDIIQRKGLYPAPPDVSQEIPGLEVSGVIEKCGSDVRGWHLGEQVCALLSGAGYAEYVAVDSRHCLPIPENLSFPEAASLPETVFTVWHNVFQRGKFKSGERLLVHGGSSGIGITAIQLARILGGRIFTTVGDKKKAALCKALGADICVNYKSEDFGALLKEEGVDVILDMIGGDYTAKNLKLLRNDGRLIFINAMKGGKMELDALDIMRRRLTITGSTLRPRDAEFKAALTQEIHEKVWPLVSRGDFKPQVFKVFPLPQAADAHRLMESSNHIGKIVLSVS